MSVIAKQSTARTVIVGPILDADGVAVTDAVVGDLKIAKNGAAPAALNGSATLTHRHTGHYSLALTASDLGTVGQAEITIDATTNAMPTKVITVVEEAIYDALFADAATGLLPANVTQWKGVAPASLTDTDKLQASVAHYTVGTAQTGDSFARIGAPTGASLAADVQTRSSHSAADVRSEMDANSTKLSDVNADTDTLLARLTAARAGYLDNLNVGGLVASSAEVTVIQNSVRNAVVTPSDRQIPTSSAERFVIDVYIYDTAGSMEDPDSNTVNIHARTFDGTSRDSNLYDAATAGSNATTMTRIAAGHYRLWYEVGTGHAEEQIRIDIDYAEGGNTILGGATTQIVAVSSGGGFNSSDRTLLTDVHNKLPSKAYLTGTVNSDGDVQLDEATGNANANVVQWKGTAPADLTDTDKLQASVAHYTVGTAQTGDSFARIGAPTGASLAADVQTRSSHSIADVLAQAEAALRTYHLDHLIGADAPTGILVAGSFLSDLIEDDGGQWRFNANALELAPAGGGGGGSSPWSESEKDAVVAKTALITSAGITVTNGTHIVPSGDSYALTLVQGEAYLDAINNAVELTITDTRLPATADGDGTVFKLQIRDTTNRGATAKTYTGTLAAWDSSTKQATLKFDVPKADTEDFPRGDSSMRYEIDAEIAGAAANVLTLVADAPVTIKPHVQ